MQVPTHSQNSYLYMYLAEKFSKIPSHGKRVVATYDDSILSGFNTNQSVEDNSCCTIEEGNQHIVLSFH